MNHERKTKKELIQELKKLHRQVSMLEKSEVRSQQLQEVSGNPDGIFKSIFEGVNDALIYLDTKGFILEVNRIAVEIFGGTKKELIGKHFTKIGIFSLKDIPQLISNFKKIISGKKSNIELKLKNKKGNEIFLECKASLKKTNGKIIGIMVVARDITERKQSEEALQGERDKLKQIFKAMDDGIYIVNQDYDIEYVNPVLMKDFGSYEGRKCYEYFHDREEVCPWCKNQDVFAGKTVRWEWHSFKNGKTYDLIDTPLKNADGTISKLEIFHDITERKQAEEQLQYLSSITKQTTEGMALVDLEGNIKFVNNAFARMHGYSSEELIGKNLSIFHTSEQMPSVEVANQQIKETGEFNGEIWHVRRDGTVFPTLMHNSLFYNQSGKPVGIIGVCRDITERKQAEEALRENQAKLSTIIEHSNELFYIHDNNHKLTYVSPTSIKIFGYTPEEMMVKWTELVTDNPINQIGFELTEKAINTGERQKPYILEVKRKDGKKILVEVDESPIKDETGKVIGITGALRDITERKQAEEALHQYKHIVSSSTDMLALLDKRFNYLAANKAYMDAFKLNPEQLIGHTVAKVFGEEFFNSVIKPNADRCLDGEEVNYQDWFNFPIHGQRYMDITYYPYYSEDRKIIGFVVNGRNITERKQAEEALHESEFKLKSIFRAAPVGIGLIVDRVVKKVNHRLCEILGYSENEIIDQNARMFYPTDEEFEYVGREKYKQIREHGTGSVETRLLCKDGKIIDVLLSSTPLNPHDLSAGVTFTVLDITERKRTENLINIQRDIAFAISGTSNLDEGLRFCFEGILDASGMDCGGVYLINETSGALELVFHKGLSPGFVQSALHFDADSSNTQFVKAGKPVYSSHQKLGIPLDKARLTECLRAIAVIPIHHNNQVIGCLNISSHTLDDVPVYARSALETLATQIGSTIVRLKTEESLKESKARLVDAQRIAGLGYWEWDIHSQKSFWSEQMFKIYKRSTNLGPLSETWIDHVPPEDKEHVLEAIEKAHSGEKEYNLDHGIICMDGEIKQIHTEAKVIRDKQGKPIRMVGVALDITERKQTEKALSESEHKYRSLTELLPVCVFETDATGKITFANRISFEKFGYNQEDFEKGVNSIDTLVPADRDRAMRNAAKIMKGEKIGSSEYKALRKNGTVFDISIHSSPIMNGGKTVGLRGVILDITERKQIIEALQASEERYRILVENASDGIIVAQDGWIKFVNPRVIEIIKYMKDELLSTPFIEFIHPDDREKAVEINRKRINGEDTPEVYCLRVKDGDGTLKWLEISGVQITWEEKPASLNFVKDITERKQAEMALKKSENQYHELFESVMEGIGIVDENEIIEFCNPAFAKIFEENSAGDLVGKDLLDYFPESQKEIIIAETGIRKKGKSSQYELEMITARGRKRIIFASIAPRFDENNRFIGAFGSILDITETKRLQEFASRAQRLETAGRIAGQVAHDFNNLLGPIVAYPELIKNDLPKDCSANQLLDDIEKAAAAMADINQQLLTLSRRGHYEQTPLNLNDIIGYVLDQLDPQPNTLYIETDLNEKLMNIKGGPSQILRIISNLINNSLDAMLGQGHLFIKTENYYVNDIIGKYGRVPRGEYVKITITDTGCGITKEALPSIFDPFFTTKSADKKRGSGLGLSVVHAVVEDHGGYIDLETKVGQGTSFYLYFPISRESVEILKSDTIIGGTESVLVVDDDTLQREVALNLLEKLGYKTTAVESGERAIEFLRENPRDLLVLDMVMPGGMDGTETYQRALEINSDQKAIIVSGYAETERVDIAIKLGAGAFIKKPLTLRNLSATVRKELDKILP